MFTSAVSEGIIAPLCQIKICLQLIWDGTKTKCYTEQKSSKTALRNQNLTQLAGTGLGPTLTSKRLNIIHKTFWVQLFCAVRVCWKVTNETKRAICRMVLCTILHAWLRYICLTVKLKAAQCWTCLWSEGHWLDQSLKRRLLDDWWANGFSWLSTSWYDCIQLSWDEQSRRAFTLLINRKNPVKVLKINK